jgi:subtilisin
MHTVWKPLCVAGLLTLLIPACQQRNDVPPGPAIDCLVRAATDNGQVIAGQYIVTANLGTSVSGLPTARRADVVTAFLETRHIDEPIVEPLSSMDGQTIFLAYLDASEADRLRLDPAVLTLEADRVVSICSCVDVVAPTTLLWNATQTGYGRGDIQTGRTAWVIDTGIDLDHPDLNVDATRSRSFLTNNSNSASAGADDQNGHGTHVAGIIGALNNQVGMVGIASGARLVALKVLDQLGTGRLSGVVAAVNHVVQNGRAGDVVNMSLGGEGQSATLERAIRQAANAGILFAIAAGNDAESTEGQSPANINHPNVFTVSAIDRTNRLATFSNYGPSVDVAAYGVRITSTYLAGRYATLSGTSMAAPHVAGLLYIRGNKLPLNGTVQDTRANQSIPIARE